MPTGFQEYIITAPVAGDVLLTSPIVLTDAQIEAILALIAVDYPLNTTVGYNMTDNTFFATTVKP